MKRFSQTLAAIFIAGALLFAPVALPQEAAPQVLGQSSARMLQPDFVSGEIVFTLKHSYPALQLCQEYGLELNLEKENVSRLKNIRSPQERIHLAKTSQDLDELLERLNQDPRIDYAEKRYVYTVEPDRVQQCTAIAPLIAPAQDSLRLNQWGLRAMQVPESGVQSNALVAVVDTGVNPITPELAANIVGGYDFFNNSSDYSDTVGHGTYVAATIAGRYGVGRFKILAQKAYAGRNSSGQALIDSVAAAEAIRDAVDKGAKVINLSFGGKGDTPKSQLRAIQYAGEQGVLCVAGSGNDRIDTSDVGFSPATCGEWNMISVAATELSDPSNLDSERFASYSNWGRHTIQVTAPGSVFSEESTESTYVFRSGTSYAAPFVSGIAAWAFEIYPDARMVKEVILSTTDTLALLSDKVAAAGRINARRVASAERNSDPQVSIASQFQGTKKTPLNISLVLSNPSQGAFRFRWEFGDGKIEDTDASIVTHTYKKKKAYQLVCTATYFTGRTYTLNTIVTITKK